MTRNDRRSSAVNLHAKSNFLKLVIVFAMWHQYM